MLGLRESSAYPDTQNGKFECSGDPDDEDPVQVVCDKGDCTADPSDASVNLNGLVTLDSSGNRFMGDTEIEIRDESGVLVQDLKIHTSCSQQLEVGDQFGSLLLVGIVPQGSDPTEIFGVYDLTICQPGEGPQGPQGKMGETGAQGVQGKLGETGAQGVQGKVGNTGAQGVQGKVGNTGTQGVQGKVGNTGAQGGQGVQGKVGNTGAQGGQGVQGKVGNTGAQGGQGVQGKVGNTGPQGPTGATGTSAPLQTTVFLALATDQTIGTTGKYIGLGSQAGSHDNVSIVVPAGAGAEVTLFVAKVSQGNTARFGDAEIFKDGPTDSGTLIGGCALDPATTDEDVTRCMVMFDAEFDPLSILVLKDSLSCFIRTDGGSFTGGSCSVLIDLGTADPL